jgi:hypothetical protein
VKKTIPPQPTILGNKAPMVDGKEPLNQNNEHLQELKSVRQQSAIFVGNVPLSRPTNAFIQEKITRHPVYGPTSLNLEGKDFLSFLNTYAFFSQGS